jgi:transposase-like protein
MLAALIVGGLGALNTFAGGRFIPDEDLRGRNLYYAAPLVFLLTATRDLDAAKRFFHKALQYQPLLSPDRIGTDGASPYPAAIVEAKKDALLPRTPVHDVTKHLQHGIESDHLGLSQSFGV